jgi:SAM-dependent methyltransferase
MSSLKPDRCPISGETRCHLVFSYDAPPVGEIGFRRPQGEPYRREIWQFETSNHFVSRHAMTVATNYEGDYVEATYGGAQGLRAAFERVVNLPPQKSDNEGRIARVQAFAQARWSDRQGLRLLDVGSGLGVFPYVVKRAGWSCTANDPDPHAARHMREHVGVDVIQGDFMKISPGGNFDIVTLNKVLEHVPDPIAMLARARDLLAPGGFVYVELPDGEMAAQAGAGREEFFVEHLHVFSFASIVMLGQKAGLVPLAVERLQEPSTKFTLRAFFEEERA